MTPMNHIALQTMDFWTLIPPAANHEPWPASETGTIIESEISHSPEQQLPEQKLSGSAARCRQPPHRAARRESGIAPIDTRLAELTEVIRANHLATCRPMATDLGRDHQGCCLHLRRRLPCLLPIVSEPRSNQAIFRKFDFLFTYQLPISVRLIVVRRANGCACVYVFSRL